MNVASKNKVETFYSRGKLLLSGEYLVLKGAKALALPLKFGQTLEVEKRDEGNGIIWESYMYNTIWFTAQFNNQLEILETNKPEIAERLQKILKFSSQMNPYFLNHGVSFKVKSMSNFNFGWGIGSSSTLISNIAYWANVDAYKLNEQVFGGSGFDIACSRNSAPFLYEWKDEKRTISPGEFDPPFKQELIFVYLGQKQNTQRSIKKFHESATYNEDDLQKISMISEQLLNVQHKREFMNLLLEHEIIISKVLGSQRIQEERFSDFDGVLKSLGSWGGDFILAVSEKSNEYIIEYFKQKELTTFFRYDEIVL